MNRTEFISILSLTLAKGKPSSCSIKTRRICNTCKHSLGRSIYFEKGVKNVEIDSMHETIRIFYDATKTNPEKLKKYIVSIGYDANELKADTKKRDIIRPCCESDITICK